MRVFSVAVVFMSLALLAAGCKDEGSAADGSVRQDGGARDGVVTPDGPEVCVDLPERFDADYTVKKGCYYAKKTPRIAAAVRLTIEPGVKIIFSEDVGLEISADQVLAAQGTEAEPILFTGAQQTRGFWKGVLFSGTQSDDNVLEWVTVEYGGHTKYDGNIAGIKLNADSRGVHASIKRCTVRESMGWGVFLGGSAVVPEFSNNTLTKNGKGPAYVSSEIIPVLDSASTYTGNDRDELVVQAQYLQKPGTWHLLDVPYYIETAGGLSVTGSWTIEPGVTLIAKQGIWIEISGDDAGLTAKGTADKPITFTCEKQERGGWDGLRIGSTKATNTMDHVVVEWAGSTASDKTAGAVKLIADSRGMNLTMTNTTIRESQGYALHATGSAILPTFTGNKLTASTLGPVNIGSLAVHQLLPSSDFTGNDVDRIFVSGLYVSPGVTWQNLGVPYEIDKIQISKPWTIEAGVVMMLKQGGSITADGDDAILNAVGTAAAPITFTSAQATKAPGDWASIAFNNTRGNANTMDYCTVEFGGGGTAQGWKGMILATSDSRGVALALTNSIVRKSAVYGVWAGLWANVTTTGTTFTDNALGDVFKDQ